uniref:Uncharacterized protein n=1 Tax=Anguilla anguilla TaxID=7936 RepID=A0A0E9TI06_ANGAN
MSFIITNSCSNQPCTQVCQTQTESYTPLPGHEHGPKTGVWALANLDHPTQK